MRRLFLALLLLGLATLLIPGLRERAQPRIDTSREWLGQKLEGPLSPILTPYRTLRTQSRIAEAAQVLVRDRNRGRDVPLPSGFSEYLTRHDLDPNDGWGAPLLLDPQQDSVAVVSAGPDLQYQTEDDILTKIRYRSSHRRPGRR